MKNIAENLLWSLSLVFKYGTAEEDDIQILADLGLIRQDKRNKVRKVYVLTKQGEEILAAV